MSVSDHLQLWMIVSDVKLWRHYLLSVIARDGPIQMIGDYIGRKIYNVIIACSKLIMHEHMKWTMLRTLHFITTNNLLLSRCDVGRHFRFLFGWYTNRLTLAPWCILMAAAAMLKNQKSPYLDNGLTDRLARRRTLTLLTLNCDP